jgi:hypothetical protein
VVAVPSAWLATVRFKREFALEFRAETWSGGCSAIRLHSSLSDSEFWLRFAHAESTGLARAVAALG